jgi:hypothetical protein
VSAARRAFCSKALYLAVSRVSATYSVMTVKRARATEPNAVEIATSAASRLRAMTIRPLRSNMYQRPSRKTSNHALNCASSEIAGGIDLYSDLLTDYRRLLSATKDAVGVDHTRDARRTVCAGRGRVFLAMYRGVTHDDSGAMP